jgi:tetratricopeptide (TPR) repeat protein/tRNA A-37 threonylcarbamoyl transferase component Bud32
MSDKDRIASILGDWYARRGGNDADAPEDVIRAHPDLAEELRSHFEALGWLEAAPAVIPELPEGAPKELGDFRILKEIGRGGMGVVYEAEQVSMGRRVALKVLSPSFTGSRQAVARFRREARAAGTLHHTNIVPVFAMGEDQGFFFYAMERVDGPALGDVITRMRGPSEGADEKILDEPPGEAERHLGDSGDPSFYPRLAEMVAGVGEALHAAHEEGIVHRDVKPANLLLSREGTLKLVDFGLARLAGDGASMTMTGQIIGTPFYMSPEQAMAKKVNVDHRSDIYSLGATLYELLTLRPPFSGDSIQEVCSQIISKEAMPPRRVDSRVPRDLETIVQRAMEKEPARRYATAAEMAEDLRRFADGVPIRARRIGPAGRAWRKVKRNKVRSVLAASVLLLAVVGTLLALRAAREAEERRRVEYDALIARAEDAMVQSTGAFPRSDRPSGPHPKENARDLLARAIEVDPDRLDAYWLRALASRRTTEERLADVDAALARGLPVGTGHRLRAYFLTAARRHEEAAAERELAAAHPSDSPVDFYARARILEEEWRWREAVEVLTRIVDSPEARSSMRSLALRRRAKLRTQLGDWHGALDDLTGLTTLGDDRLMTRVRIAAIWRCLSQEERAEELFAEILRDVRSEGSAKAWEYLGVVCGACNQGEWLQRTLEEGLEKHPDSAALEFYRGVYLRGQGDQEGALAAFDEAIRRDPDQHDCHARRAELLEDLGRAEEALESIDRAVALDPDCPRCLNTRAYILGRHMERYEEALESYDRALALDPSNANLHAYRATTLMWLGRGEEALRAIDHCLALAPGYARGHSTRCWILHETGRLVEALAAANRAIELGPADPDARDKRALVLIDLGRAEDALADNEEAVRLDPANAVYRWNLSVALRELGRTEEALAACEEARELDPKNAVLVYGRACLLHQLGRLDEALPAFEEAARRDPENATWHYSRGLALRDLGRPAAALSACDAALRLDPEMVDAHLSRAALLLNELGRPEDALEAGRHAIELDADRAEAWQCCAVACERLGRFEEADAAWAKAVELAPDRVEWMVMWGQTLIEKVGRHEKALVVLGRALELDPESVSAHHARGCALSRLGRFDEALAEHEKVLELDPDHAWARFNRGAILHNVHRRFEEALAEFDRALALEPGNPNVHINRGIVLKSLGRREEAVDAFAKALEIEPANAGARDRLVKEIGARNGEIAVDPGNAAAHWARAQVCLALWNGEEALTSLARAAELDPAYLEDPLFWRRSGVAHMLRRKPAEALAAFRRCAEMEPGSSAAAYNLAGALQALGRFAEALECCDRAVELEPEIADTHNFRGMILCDGLQRYEEALEAFDRTLAIEPGRWDALQNRGVALNGLGRFREALAAYGEALAASEKLLENSHFHRLRARSLAGLGWHEDALQALEAARRCDPAPDAIGYALRTIDSLRPLGREEEARKVALEAVPDEPAPQRAVTIAWLLAFAGERERALAALEVHEGAWSPPEAYDRACVHALLGQVEDALDWLERAVEAGHRIPPGTPADPDFAALEEDPRYQAVRAKLLE